jgi:hypothetical protein
MLIEAFTNQINKYFAKLIDIIHYFEGQVVKFSGGELYVVWQVGDSSMQEELVKAIACAAKINKDCNKHEVRFVPIDPNRQHVQYESLNNQLKHAVSGTTDISIPSSLGRRPSGSSKASLTEEDLDSSLHGRNPDCSIRRRISAMISEDIVEVNRNEEDGVTEQGKGDEVLFLHVHSGISAGIMAGVEVL